MKCNKVAIFQVKSFMLTGCITYLATIVGLIFNIIYIVNAIINNAGAWPIIGAILFALASLIIGTGLGFLFQSYAWFLKRLSLCRCAKHSEED